MGLFSKIKEGLKKTKDVIAYKLNKLFTGGALDDDFYDELEYVLLSSDVGAATTERILEELRDVVDEKLIRTREKVKDELKQLLIDILDENPLPEYEYPLIIMVSGVNGVGKTTAMGKLAKKFKKQGKNVLLVAADTFRADAADQLTVWSIDTAGRLHNKKNLMDELGKISRIVDREMPDALYLNYIVLDATTGQNAISQVDVFNEAVDIDGIILTKLDGTAKGGVVFAISNELEVPVVYVGVGEGIDDLEDFDSKSFVDAIIE